MGNFSTHAEGLKEVKFYCEAEEGFSFQFDRGWDINRRGDYFFETQVTISDDGYNNTYTADEIIDFHVGKETTLSFVYSRDIKANFYTTTNVYLIPIGVQFDGEITVGISNKIVTFPLTCTTQEPSQW